MLFMQVYHKYHSKDRKVFLGRTDKMDKILNIKNQEYFQIIVAKKWKEIKRKTVIALERIPYMW